MADLEDYPTERPEDNRVKNPLSGQWIKKSYAKSEGILEQAKEHTQKHFKEQDEEGEVSEEIDQLLQEAEEVEPGEAFKVDDEELSRLDERADINHPEIPDSGFPDEEDFDPGEDTPFDQPPTPEGLDQAAQQSQSSGEYKGVYSGKSSSGQAPMQEQAESKRTELEKKHEDQDVRYVKTEHGGMKVVHLDEDEE